MMQQQVFLIGSMGSGKSYTARAWSKLSGFPYIDLDHEIEQRAGQDIPNIFAEQGEAHFRELEKSTLQSLPQGDKIVACGGGTPCFFDNMDWMKTQGLVIYLQAPIELLCQRLATETDHRPLLQSATLKDKIQALLTERGPCYERAHFIFKQQSKHDQVAEQLHQYFKLELR